MSGSFRERFEKWFSAKWEHAEDWLPWILGLGAGLFLIAGLTIGFINSHSREPASFVEISDSEVPAKEIYSDESVDSLSSKNSSSFGRGNKVVRMGGNDDGKTHLRFKARTESQTSNGDGGGSGHSFIISLRDEVSASEIEKRTGIPTVRAREVAMVSDALFRQPGKEIAMRLELFADVTPTFQMKLDSQYAVNQGMHSGYAKDDPSSRASFTTEGGMVSGFIKYQGKDYRIVADPPRSVHYIIEVRN